MQFRPRHTTAVSILILIAPFTVHAGDHGQWGQPHSRNMVSDETGLPARIDPDTDTRWKVSLGSDAYSTPVIAGGRVLIGANNAQPRDRRYQGDRAVLLCLDESDGSLLWQLVVPRISDDKFKDWPRVGLCSPPTVEGDRAYVVTNRFEVVCLDLKGQADGNDGPYRDEGRHAVPAGEPPVTPTGRDADILWLFDMVAEGVTYPHDSAHASILLDGDLLYLNTCNGVDNTHQVIRRPQAPSLIVLDKHTGRLVARDRESIGPRIFHSTWSSPSLGTVNQRKLVFFGGGDGVCYAFEAPDSDRPDTAPVSLRRAWSFDCDPNAPKDQVHSYYRNRHQSPSVIYGMPVFHRNRVYLTAGGDIWWGKRQSWLLCIDATQTGDITDSGLVWKQPLVSHCCATPAIRDGLVYVADCGGILHCFDADSGQPCWTHDLEREAWGSVLAADGKIYVGTRRGELWILATGRTRQVLDRIRLDAPIASTPVAANSTLYIATKRTLYAIRSNR